MKLKPIIIIEALNTAADEMSLADLQQTTGIPQATLTRLLSDLIDAGYARKVAHGRYTAGSKQMRKQAGRVHFLGLQSTNIAPFHTGAQEVFDAAGIAFSSEPSPAAKHFAELTSEDAIEIYEHCGKPEGFMFFSNSVAGEQFVPQLQRLGATVMNVGLNCHMPYDTVATDFEAGGEAMVDELYRNGHRNIGFVAQRSLLSNLAFRERRRGYELGMAKYGLLPRTLFYDQHETAEDNSLVVHWLRDQIDQDERLTGLVISGHSMDRDVVAAAAELGLRIPKDLSIVCFGLRTGMRGLHPDLKIDTFDGFLEPWEDLGRAAAARMISRLANPRLPAVMIKVPLPRMKGQSVGEV